MRFRVLQVCLKIFCFDYGEFSHSYLSLLIAVKCGANPLTMSGLSGIGDLILTFTGDLSRYVILHSNENVDFSKFASNLLLVFYRNRNVGIQIGKGEKLDDITKNMSAVAEGVLTSKSAHLLDQKVGVE